MAKECELIGASEKVIQVDAVLVPSSIYGVQHLQVVYSDPLMAPSFLKNTVRPRREVLRRFFPSM